MSNFSLSSTTHRIIITYLCIVLGFLLIGFVVWNYFEYKTTELRLKGGYGASVAAEVSADFIVACHTETDMPPVSMHLPNAERSKPRGKDPSVRGNDPSAGGRSASRAGRPASVGGKAYAAVGKPISMAGIASSDAGMSGSHIGTFISYKGSSATAPGKANAAQITDPLPLQS